MSFKELSIMSDKKGTVLFYPYIPTKSLKILKNTLSTRWIGQGPMVDKFEKKFSDIFLPNGAIYIFYASDFMKKKYLDITNAKPFYMNNFESLDIDDKYDYNHAQKISKEYLIYKKN